jgi:hypothetical protein
LIDQESNSTYFRQKRENGQTIIITQKLRSDGLNIYPAGGIPVTSSPWSQFGPSMIIGYGEDIIYTWVEYDTTMHIYSQMLDSAGNKLWNSRGILTCDPGLQYQKMVTDCRGGFIIVGYKDDFFSIMVQQVNRNGQLGVVIDGVGEKVKTTTPKDFYLFQNFPNPFNPATVIRYDVYKRGYISLKLFDLAGRLVTTLAEGDRTPGNYSVAFQPQSLSSGTYYYVLQSTESKITKQLTFIK